VHRHFCRHQDRLNESSANAHSVSYLTHTELMILHDNSFYSSQTAVPTRAYLQGLFCFDETLQPDV